MRIFLTTVGTSLIANAKRSIGRQFHDVISSEELSQFIQNEPNDKASAETNSLSRLLQPDDQVVFICSDTVDGSLCAEILCSFYRDNGLIARLHRVSGLTYSNKQFKMRGLRSLVGELCQLVTTEQRSGKEVCINATGGFKAEVAYATLIGLMFNAPVFYIHEAFRDIIEMPPMPLRWDFSPIAEHECFFEWIKADRRTSREVKKRLISLPSAIRAWVVEEDQCTMLSAAGEVALAAYAAHLWQCREVDVWLSAAANRSYKLADSHVKDIFHGILDRLRSRELRRMGSIQVRGCDCLLYPSSNRDLQVFYFEEADGTLRVCELEECDAHNAEAFAERGVLRNDYADNEFIRWQAPSI